MKLTHLPACFHGAAVKDGELVLCDLGGEYHGYASDITCSYPSNGKFTPEQRIVYQGVLNAGAVPHHNTHTHTHNKHAHTHATNTYTNTTNTHTHTYTRVQ